MLRKMRLAMFVVVAVFCAGLTPAEPVLHVAALLPLSGPLADEGVVIQRGLELAGQKLSRRVRFELHFEDTQGDTKTAVTAFKRIAAQFKPAVFITWGSGIGIALMPLVEQAGVLQINVAASAPGYTRAGDFSIRLFPTAAQEAAFLGDKVLRDLKMHKLTVLHSDNEYGQGLADQLAASITARGGTVVAAEAVQPRETDFVPALLRLRSHRPNGLYVACYAGCAVRVLQQAAKIGLKVPLIASSASVAMENFAQQAGVAAEGLYVVLAGPDYQNPASAEVEAFVKEYSRAFDSRPDPMFILAARGYDALHLVAGALSSCRPAQTSCLRDQLLQLRNYPGASGRITFDKAGDSETRFGLYRVQNGSYQAVP